MLAEVFPGFFALWSDTLWCDHLRKTLYWYLVANDYSMGIRADAGIILAQTALERLAWVHCVKHRNIVSPAAFARKGLSAADKIRMLATTFGIPTQLPDTMKALNAKRGEKWASIPDAIAEIRNALVHPYDKDSPPKGAYYEAWRLSMWLLDLALLRLCKHTGHYASRLADGRWAGTVEQVPWAKETSTQKAEQSGTNEEQNLR